MHGGGGALTPDRPAVRLLRWALSGCFFVRFNGQLVARYIAPREIKYDRACPIGLSLIADIFELDRLQPIFEHEHKHKRAYLHI